jgi:amino acid adenylation domain-containing protein
MTNVKIAVIGLACRFPGADNMDEFWSNLVAGKDTIKHFTNEELSEFEPDFDSLVNDCDYVKARGVLSGIDKFDAGFFGMSNAEAAGTDPQHRIWLETAWEAFENAGCDPVGYKGSISVFAGGYTSTYLLNNILRDPKKLENYIRLRQAESYQILTSNDISFLSTKTAYKFNLKGPAINVQTACSTSLVAIVQACDSLFTFESDISLAGGVCISVPQESGYVFQEGAIPSPDGCCRPFDAQAKGTVPANGVGAVILKRYEDAVRDNDRIYAVIDGWAVNNDGSNKVSYTAPSIEGQAEVIMMAQSFAGVSPENIGYIEAHGTATPMGDPIEVAALKKAFSAKTAKKQFCGIGSVKSNIGHTDAAAGVASFIKACLAAYYKKIPASLHYSEPNPHIDFENSPFYVVNESKEWKHANPLIIGVSSFGIGGTNAHVILEQPPVRNRTETASTEWPQLIVLSAKSETSLNDRKIEFVEFLRNNPGLNIQEVAGTLVFGRNHMPFRSFNVASELCELTSDKGTFTDGKKEGINAEIAFMFPGQGAQYAGMGKDLYKNNKTFRRILDECFSIISSETGEDLKSILFDSGNIEKSEQKLARTDLTQPALFVIEYALAKVLEELDIKPRYLIGHSIGEYTAACIAGVFDLRTALKIVIKRGQLMQSMPSGKMMAVKSGFDGLLQISNGCFEIAADNAHGSCTISFRNIDDEKVQGLLQKNDIPFVGLNTSHAFHSAAFDPVLSEFRDFVNQFTLNPPRIPFISCLTGTFITSEDATSGAYWAKQLRNTVLFRQGISKISESEGIVYLEVGPNTHLSSLIRQNKNIPNKKRIISTLGKPDETCDRYKIMSALGRLYTIGIDLNFEVVQNVARFNKIGLPGYPFEKTRHWIDFKPGVIPGYSISEDKNSNSAAAADDDLSDNLSFDESGNHDKTTAKISQIWKSLIGSEKIGADDDFFEIGGHSLMALQILSRIKEVFGIGIQLSLFLNNPTIRTLSEIVKKEVPGTAVSKKMNHLTDLTNLPLSDDQRRLWTVSQFDKLNPAYNILFTYQLEGDLNIDVFNHSMNVLFNRHHIMFSLFKQRDGIPYCQIVPKPVHIEFKDYSAGSCKNPAEEILSFIGADSRKCFDLETGPLYRLFLFKVNDSSYYFHAAIHHLIFDGWSWGVFIDNLNKIYKGLALNENIQLDELEFQHYDYAQWQENEGNSLNEEKLTKFWSSYLKGCPAAINFPYDRVRKDVSTGFGRKVYIKINSELANALKAVSRDENSTLYVTLLSAFGVLLSRYSGDKDICIGTPVANRPQSKLEEIFGMFVNTIVIRLNIERNKPFGKFVASARNSVIDAISNQELQFEKIVEAVKPERSFNTNPLFQVCFAWQNNLSIPLETEGVTGKRITVEEGVSPFDLTFYMWENEDYIEGEIEYNIDILDTETILRLKENFLTLIQSIVENPETNISDLPLIAANEIDKINSFTGSESYYPKDKTVVQLFQEQVSLYPGKTALVFEESTLTYTQLDEKSTQLARTLRISGVTENTPVGIITDKSPDFIIGILGILKAGGGYVPVDPDYPKQRKELIIRDSGCKIVLVQDKFRDLNFEGSSSINLNSPSSFSEDRSSCLNSCTPTDLAYIMYTSGTTGMPKGSMICHRGIVRLVKNTNYIELTQNDRILLTGAIVFDASTFEIWGALLNGGTLYIVGKETILNPKALGEELLNNDITILWLTSALFTQIAESRTDIFRKLKSLLSGGDVLSAQHINKVRRDNPALKVINGYGPTENTTFSTTYLIEKDFESNIPIGKPISNSTAYIFDRNMKYQPIGVIGELYVGGDGLSMGYLNRDDLNKKSFVEHPEKTGERLYRTGDYAKWLSDGNIGFHGRIDNQLKIRGFRVELEEIAAVLSEIDGVIEAVIKPVCLQEGDVRLASFLNVTEDFSMDTREIAALASKRLPQYMVPSVFKLMHGFPTNVNGKTDRDALTVDLSEMVHRENRELRSLTPREKIIFDIWCDALKTTDIAPTDNFFDIGGNSLMAISVFSKIETAFNLNLKLRIFFDSPRIDELARAIDITILANSEKNTAKVIVNKISGIIDGEI